MARLLLLLLLLLGRRHRPTSHLRGWLKLINAKDGARRDGLR